MSEKISPSIPRIDGQRKAAGEELYIADYRHDGFLTARFVRSQFTRGTITSLEIPELPDGYYAVDYRDVPGANEVPLIKTDWPAFAEREIRYQGQIIMIIAGPDPQVVDRLVSEVSVSYDETVPAVTPDEGLAVVGGPIHGRDNIYADLEIERGDAKRAFAEAARTIEGTYETGFQEQLYLEPQGLTATADRDGRTVVVQGSMQCPYYVKHAVEHVMGDGIHVRVVQTTTGGGFGGKEDYPEIMGAPLAVAAWKIGKPLRMIFDRFEDLSWTSKRHPSRTRVRTAHDATGAITAVDIDILLDGGAYESYSLIVLQRAIFTSTGVYNFPNCHVHGRAVATNTVPSGAFRGFGAPQAIFAIETHMERVAEELDIDPIDARRPYFLKKGDTTLTGGTIREDVILDALLERGIADSNYATKRTAYRSTPNRGIGVSIFAHGCGFTGDGEQRLIKGRVKLTKDENDRVSILTASIDMGQGPRTTFRKVAGTVLGIPPEDIAYDNPDTDIVPDSGPTVASRTIMIVGYLVQEAAKKLKADWRPGEVQEVEEAYAMPPGITWDQDTFSGDAYAVFGWGVNIVEVEIDPVSYETEVLGAWGVYDVGVPIDERVVHGQIHGGMSQALGYGSLEKLEVDRNGVFMQRTMADYIVPTSLDFPRTGAATVDNPYPYGPFGAKGMGEMVHDGGHAALAAAVSQAVGAGCNTIPLAPERLMRIVNDAH